MKEKERALRLHETIYPFGPGAIVDILGESFIAPDITNWPKVGSRPLRCIRLERELGVRGFRTAPVQPSGIGKQAPSLDYWRFPKWRFCQSCLLMSDSMNWVQGIARNTCQSCGKGMVPMRFVAVCEKGGHVQDLEWRSWTHRRGQTDEQKQCRDKKRLYFKTSVGRGESLSQTHISCQACGAERDLGLLSGEKALVSDGYRCRGTQPWEYSTDDSFCSEELRAVQRGSTSLHVAEIVTALDIPEEVSRSEQIRDKVREHPMFAALAGLDGGPAEDHIAALIATDSGATKALVLSLSREGATPTLQEATANLLAGEWAAFENAVLGNGHEPHPDFDVAKETFATSLEATSALTTRIEHVAGARRLREVRAMRGFRRYKQDSTIVRVDLGKIPALDWYPAIEQFGEGIFITFNEEHVQAWESHPFVINRMAQISRRAMNLSLTSRRPEASPRYVLLHTLAHLLMRQLEFSSGYSAASLRERIYSLRGTADPQAGLLIYTASGDSQGTLGGLVRLAKKDSLARILLKSIENADLCSNDPVCRESRGQGMNALNLAACHGCSLVSETSCESGNVFLDRKLLVGDEQGPGFFDQVLEEARGRFRIVG